MADLNRDVFLNDWSKIVVLTVFLWGALLGIVFLFMFLFVFAFYCPVLFYSMILLGKNAVQYVFFSKCIAKGVVIGPNHFKIPNF